MLGIKPEIVLFGLIVGILTGLTGIGGASPMTPLLMLATSGEGSSARGQR